MSRTKGQPKTGGREKGTPNKTTTTIREWLSKLIDDNRVQVENDLKKLEPKDRLLILEKLMQYTVPKMQQINVEAEYAELERLLSNTPEQAIKAITERIIKLNQLNKTSDE